jgi:hypothetical protein
MRAALSELVLQVTTQTAGLSCPRPKASVGFATSQNMKEYLANAPQTLVVTVSEYQNMLKDVATMVG